MKLYYHQTNKGSEYLMDTYIKCSNGHKDGTINDKTKYIVRINGDIKKDTELIVGDKKEKREYIININIGIEAKTKKEAIKKLAEIMRKENFRFWFEGITNEEINN